MSVAEVAHRLGVTKHRVTAELQVAGIAGRRPGWTDGQPPAPIARAQLTELYLDGGMTVSEVAAALNTTTTRVNAALRRHGIDRRPEPATPPPPLDLDRTTLTDLYVTQRLDDAAIGDLHGVPPYRVTLRRRELGAEPRWHLPIRTHRGCRRRTSCTAGTSPRGRPSNRSPAGSTPPASGSNSGCRARRFCPTPDHSGDPHPERLRELYVEREWTAAQIALNTPTQQRLAALYADPDVTALLRRHDIPVRTEGGTITQRFSEPAEISAAFLVEAYTEIGLSAAQIEQLTGQSAERVLQLLRDSGVPVRPSGPSAPWLRRQRPYS